MASSDEEPRYKLAPGSQVREEDFGLLFYTRQGPGLYFVSSGSLLEENFFLGQHTLKAWSQRWSGAGPLAATRWLAMKRTLESLEEKGVILAC